MAAPVTNKESDKWNERYQSKRQTVGATNLSPAYVLHEFQHLLPVKGMALDLASGLGANALFLAQHTLQAHAWDISSVAIEKLNAAAKSLDLNLNTEVRDIVAKPPEENSFDVIVVSHFLDRRIMPDIIAALRQNGLLFYQTFTKARTQESGPTNETYRLDKNELLSLCEDLDVIVYREEGLIGDNDSGFRNEAIFIGQCKSDSVTSV